MYLASIVDVATVGCSGINVPVQSASEYALIGYAGQLDTQHGRAGLVLNRNSKLTVQVLSGRVCTAKYIRAPTMD